MVGLNSNFCWGMGKPEPNASFCPSVFAADKMFLWNFVANRFGTQLTPQSGLLSLDVDEYAVLSDQAQTGSGAGIGGTPLGTWYWFRIYCRAFTRIRLLELRWKNGQSFTKHPLKTKWLAVWGTGYPRCHYALLHEPTNPSPKSCFVQNPLVFRQPSENRLGGIHGTMHSRKSGLAMKFTTLLWFGMAINYIRV